MQREWDGSHDISFKPETWAALAEHLLPGAFVLAFASSRGWHRLACAMEDSGLVMQPSIFVNGLEMDVPFCLGWAQSQGFPKSTRIDTAIDKAAGKSNERRVIGHRQYERSPYKADGTRSEQGDNRWSSARALTKPTVVEPATPLARVWQGHRYGGQILRNALEPIICAQKPWVGKRLDCIVKTGAGAINVDKGRIPTSGESLDGGGQITPVSEGWDRPYRHDPKRRAELIEKKNQSVLHAERLGRWPQNLILIHTEFCLREGVRRVKGTTTVRHNKGVSGCWWYSNYPNTKEDVTHADADGLETVATWRCLIACPECGYTWLAMDKEVCPECKAMGEWQCAVRRLGEQGGMKGSGGYPARKGPDGACYGHYEQKPTGKEGHLRGIGDCTRYFFQADWFYEIAERLAMADPVHYCPKSSTRERDAGLDNFKSHDLGDADRYTMSGSMPRNYTAKDGIGRSRPRCNSHPTCKPLTLNRYLATLLLAPPEYAPRRILIPFAGVASEMIGALLAGFEEIVGIEMDAGYCKIGEARMKYWASRPEQMRLF